MRLDDYWNYELLLDILPSGLQIAQVVEDGRACDGRGGHFGGGDGSCGVGPRADDGLLRAGGDGQDHAHGRLLHIHVV